MTCPFLREAQVKYCRTAAVRKLIPIAQTGSAGEKCTSAAHATCSAYRAGGEAPGLDTCPYLCESLMQYCGAAPVTRFIPYSEALLSRCGGESYRYCELYLSMAHPGRPAEAADNIPMPEWLQYASNHMWLDVTADGTCHAGIDAFLSRALGRIERVSFVQSGRHRPAAVLTVEGCDLELVFPNPFQLTRCNLYLRADPTPLTREPYTVGWLFEGVPGPETQKGLYRGPDACRWMEEEERRMNQFLQEQHGAACDGGLFAQGVARALDRDDRLSLFHEFFSPYASGKSNL